eukprot:g1661.t1
MSSCDCDIPPLAYGLGTTWFGGRRGNEALTHCVHAALDAGLWHIDEAEMYGNETATGAAIESWLARAGNSTTRAELFITSKILGSIEDAGNAARAAVAGDADADAAAATAEVAAVEGGCRASLERLRVSYLDLYLMHAPFRRADGRPFAASLPQLWAAMERLVDGGLVRRIGVSNWRRADLDAVMGAARIPPACNQLEYHPLLQQPALNRTAWEQQRVAAFAYAPLSPLTKDACVGPAAGVVEAARRVGEQLAPPRSAAQVLLRWTLQTVQGVVTTSTKPERIAAAREVLDFELSDEQLSSVSAAGRAVPAVRTHWIDSLGPPLS